MAEEKAPVPAPAPEPSTGSSFSSKPQLMIGLVIVNMLFVAFVGFMLWKSLKIKEAKPSLENVIAGEAHTQESEQNKTNEEIGRVIPLETFIVNLAGSKGRKVLKVNMEFEINGQEVIQEIENRKAQIRDFIIIILSSKSHDEVSSKEGKDALRNEIKDNINSFLSKGKIINVYFTELIYN